MKPQDYTGLTQRDNKEWLYKDLTEKVIGAAMEVHRELGSGFLESRIIIKFRPEEFRDKKKNLVKICEICGYIKEAK